MKHLSQHAPSSARSAPTASVVLVVRVRARAQVEVRIRSAVDIREAARTREAVRIREAGRIQEAVRIQGALRIQEVAGSKPLRPANTCGPPDRDGNPADKDMPRIGLVLVRQEEAKSRDCKYADT